MEVISIRKSYI